MKHTTDNASQNQNVTGHDSGAFSEKHIEQWLLENYLECTTVAEQLKVLDEFPEQLDAMQRLRDRIADLFDRQRQLQQGESIVNIAVIGDFSSGKSTFINSLLGKELCPTSDKPTTSSITKFRYGDTISFRQTDENWQALKDNSNSGSLSWEKYMELAQHGDKKQSEGLYFECLCPTEELRNIALYDTPGFNNSDSIRGAHDTKLTQTMLESADVILLLVDINTGSIGADMVNKLRPLHAQSKKLYLILNKADLKAPSKRTAILTQCTNDFPYFEKTSWYSAIEELEGRKPKFAQQETQAPAHIFALEQERIGFTLTDKTKEAEPDFAEEFASLIENKDQEYHFIFSNAPTGNDTGFFLLRAEPAKRSENRQKLFEWFLDIKKEKEKLAQKAFYERCGEWSYQAKEVLQRLKTILRTISINSKSAQKTGIPFNEIEDIFKKWVNEQSSDLGLDKVLKQAIQKNIKRVSTK